MDFFQLYYDTDSILYGKRYNSLTHPEPETRKEALFALVEQDRYHLDTEEGNAIYYWFCLICDRYREKLVEYKNKGKLDGVVHQEVREGKHNE